MTILITPEFHLRVTGLIMLWLVGMNFLLPRRLNWGTELARLSLLNRQIFHVHAGFICVTVTMFAALTLLLTPALLEPTALARAVLGGIGLFWMLRLFAQLFVYDASLWRGNRTRTALHILFSGLWIYFVATFAYALYHNLGAHG